MVKPTPMEVRMKAIAAAQTFLEPTPVAESPQLWVLDGFASEEEVDGVLALFADEDHVRAHAWHAHWDHAGFAAEMPADGEGLLARIAERMERTTGVRTVIERSVRFRFYGEGEGHRPHTDGYETEGCKLAVTALLYLSDTEAGGETAFPAAQPEPIAIQPRRGRLVMWTSTLPGGADDPRSLHEGRAVARGDKAVLMSFAYLPLAEHAPSLRPAISACTP
jgi:hypothetical protein